MPKSNWLTPIFWMTTLAVLVFLEATLHALYIPKLLAAMLSLGVAPLIGMRSVLLFLRRFPDAYYLTPEKTDGMGYVWAPMDVLMPYFIMSVIVLAVLCARHLFAAS